MAFDLYDKDEVVVDRARGLEEKGLDANILCAKCASGHLYRRKNRLEYVVTCGVFDSGNRVMPDDIVECSDFSPRHRLSIWKLAELALEIDPRVGINDGSYR
jgi:hypothetical protein